MSKLYNEINKQLKIYLSQDNTNKSQEQIKAEVKELLDKLGANDQNTRHATVLSKNEQLKIRHFKASDIPDIIARKIQKDKNKAEKEQSNKQDNNQEEQNPKQNSSKGRKLSFTINIAELGPREPEEIANFIARKLKQAGFTDEEIRKPAAQINTLGLDNKLIDLNITPNVSILDQFVEMIKKMYLVFFSNKDPRNMDSTELHNATVREASDINADLPGDKFDLEDDFVNTEDNDLEASFNADGNNSVDINDNQIELSEEDKKEIAELGLADDINSAAEWQAFKKTDEYLQYLYNKEQSQILNG